jgi:hypothetical protein
MKLAKVAIVTDGTGDLALIAAAFRRCGYYLPILSVPTVLDYESILRNECIRITNALVSPR